MELVSDLVPLLVRLTLYDVRYCLTTLPCFLFSTPKRWITIPPIKTHFPKNHFKRHWIIFQTLFFTGHISFFLCFFFRMGKSGGPKPSVIGNRRIAANWQSLGYLTHVSAPQIIPFLIGKIPWNNKPNSIFWGCLACFPPIFVDFCFVAASSRWLKTFGEAWYLACCNMGFANCWSDDYTPERCCPWPPQTPAPGNCRFLGVKKKRVGYDCSGWSKLMM